MEKMKEMGKTTTKEWPCAFTRLKVCPERFLSEFPCNHIHGVYGDYVKELEMFAELMDIEVVMLD